MEWVHGISLRLLSKENWESGIPRWEHGELLQSNKNVSSSKKAAKAANATGIVILLGCLIEPV